MLTFVLQLFPPKGNKTDGKKGSIRVSHYFALEALLLGQISIFWAVSRPQTSSADMPASGTGLFTKYQQKKMTFRVSRIEQTYRICCFY